MYENTTPEAHRMAAELIEAGVEPHEVYRRLYEDLPFRRLQLLQRALSSVERHDDGAITIAHLVKDDYEQTGAQETDSEGIVDHMRAVEGTAVAVLVRELLSDDRNGLRKVSLRATDGRVDVSRIAREFGGGGHPQAAGFSTPLPYPRARGAAARTRARAARRPRRPEFGSPASCSAPSRPASPPTTWSPRCGAGCRAARRSATPGTLDPFATGLLLVLVGRATRAQRFLTALPKTYRAVARLGWTSDTGDRDGELVQTGRVPERLEIPAGEQLQRPPAYSAVKVAGERAYKRARRGEAVETARPSDHGPPRRAALARGRAGRVRDRVLVGHLRPHADHRPGRRLLRRARAHGDRPVPPRGRRPRPAGSARRGARVPARRELTEAEARLVRHGRRVPRAARPTARW